MLRDKYRELVKKGKLSKSGWQYKSAMSFMELEVRADIA
jgi:hypothetical protein